MADERRPVRVVIADEDQDYSAPHPGGGKGPPFPRPADWVKQLDEQVMRVEKAFESAITGERPIPAVATVRLIREALAKTKRPFELFTEKTCPIIGGDGLGELLVRVTSAGIAALRREIKKTTKVCRHAVSTIESFAPYQIADASVDTDRLGKLKGDATFKIRLFDHHDSQFNKKIHAAFSRILGGHDAEVAPLSYSRSLRLYSVSAEYPEAIIELSEFPGVQCIEEMPSYGVDTQAINIGELPDDALPLPVDGIEYPVVGLLDSGTDKENKQLQAWVVGRDEDDVPPSQQDHRHGTFIAGLMINARGLNHSDNRFPSVQCRIFDAVVFPKDGYSDEEDLINSIRRVIAANHEQVKIWNLSISSVRSACCDDKFSDFAMALDEIQDQYDVTIVTCTGNMRKHLLRPWRCDPNKLKELDRMYPAADSVRAVSVASIAHKDTPDSMVKSEEPSPFSRRGPGPAFHPKPEVSHYGGNCNEQGQFTQMGVLSIGSSSKLVERIGTSYSTPLVASMLSSLKHGIERPTSRNLAKALAIHAAILNNDSLSIDDLRYSGFGVPANIDQLLDCPPWQATLVFEPQLEPVRRIFSRESFPIPKCFRRDDGRVEGEIIMTLVYDPPLDPSAGAEYCRVNVDASLGTYDPERGGNRKHHSKVPIEPVDAKTLYEKYQLKHGFKWSPVKVYRKRMEGITGDMWRLYLQVYYRTQEEQNNHGVVQNAALIVTLQDRNKDSVYSDVMNELRQANWVTETLSMRPQLRVQGRE